MLTTEFFNDQIEKARDSGYSFAVSQLEEIRDLVAGNNASEQRDLLQSRIDHMSAEMNELEQFSREYQLFWSKRSIADNLLYYLNFHYGDGDEE